MSPQPSPAPIDGAARTEQLLQLCALFLAAQLPAAAPPPPVSSPPRAAAAVAAAVLPPPPQSLLPTITPAITPSTADYSQLLAPIVGQIESSSVVSSIGSRKTTTRGKRGQYR